MAVVARGRVADRPWGRTFAAVAARGFTGDLVVEADGKRYAVGWRGGAVVAAASPLPSDAVARIALTTQLVTPLQVGDVMRAQAAAPDRDEVDVLAEAVKLPPELAARLRRRVIATRAMRTFALAAGDFTLDDEPRLPPHPDAAIDARAIAYAGARAHFSDGRLLEELAGLGLSYRLREDAIATLAQFGFTDVEKPALARLRAAALSPHQLEEACPDLEPKSLRAMVYALASFGAVDASAPVVGRGGRASDPPATRGGSSPTIAPPPASAAAGPAPARTTPASTPPPARTTPASTTPPARTTPASTPPPARTTPASTPPPARTTPTSTAPPVSTPATSTPPPARTSPASTPPPPFGARGTAPVVPPPIPVASAAVLAAAGAEGDWSEGSSPAIRRRARKAPRSSAPPSPATGETAAAIRALVVERLALLDAGADHFTLLGIAQDSPPDELRAVYFALARQLHPDRLTAAGVVDERRDAQRLFAQINTAFAVLSQPKKRAEYLAVLRQGGEQAVRAQQDEAEQMAARLFGAEEHFRRGEMALRREQLDVALAAFKQAVELNPKEGEHHALYAWTTYATAPDKAKVKAQVKASFDEAIKQAPKSPTPFLYLGRIARLEGKDDEAMRHFQRVLELKPGHTEASSELRVLEARRGKAPTRPPEDKKGLFGFIKKP